MTAAPPIRRVRDGAEIEDLCEPHQPVALFVSSPMNEISGGQQTRCLVVGRRGAELGAVTIVRVQPGLVTASALLLDPEAAPALAGIIRRARAVRLTGGADHAGPVAALIPGASPYALELIGMPSGHLAVNIAADPRQAEWRDWVRVARLDDVPALVRIYEAFPLEFLASARLEAALTGMVRQHRVLVLEVDGQIVGAQRLEARSRHWELWGGLTILPEHRGQGLARWFDRADRELVHAEQRWSAGIMAPTNLVPHELDGMARHAWLDVRLPVEPTVAARARRWTKRQVRNRSGRGATARAAR